MPTTTEIDTKFQAGPAILKLREIRELLEAPDKRKRKDRRDAAMLAILLGTGARPVEAVRLTVDNVEVTHGGRTRIVIKTAKGRKGSPPRWRVVTLPEPMAQILKTYLKRDKPHWWLFPGYRSDHMCVRQARTIITGWIRKIGRSDLCLYSCRHTFGSMVVRQTRSIFVAQKLLGHTDPRTTAMYYAAFELSDADEAADRLTAALG